MTADRESQRIRKLSLVLILSAPVNIADGAPKPMITALIHSPLHRQAVTEASWYTRQRSRFPQIFPRIQRSLRVAPAYSREGENICLKTHNTRAVERAVRNAEGCFGVCGGPWAALGEWGTLECR